MFPTVYYYCITSHHIAEKGCSLDELVTSWLGDSQVVLVAMSLKECTIAQIIETTPRLINHTIPSDSFRARYDQMSTWLFFSYWVRLFGVHISSSRKESGLWTKKVELGREKRKERREIIPLTITDGEKERKKGKEENQFLFDFPLFLTHPANPPGRPGKGQGIEEGLIFMGAPSPPPVLFPSPIEETQ